MPNIHAPHAPHASCAPHNPLPATGYVRLSQIIGAPKASPPIPPFLPISRSTFWSWVKNGRISRPIKLSPRISVWKVEEIRDLHLTLSEQVDSARF